MVSNVQIETPVAIGGVGGCGTRLIAEMLMRVGFFLGSDLNESLDNLWFTLAFKPRPVRYAMFLDGIGPGGFQSHWSRRGLKY